MPTVSVLLPSRERPQRLVAVIDQLYSEAADPSSVETIVRLDSDDTASLALVPSLLGNARPIRLIVADREGGYRELNKMFNQCCSVATGEWLFLYNDDAEILGQWDAALREYNPRTPCVVKFQEREEESPQKVQPPIRPIVPRRYYDILHYWSLHVLNDSWIYEVMCRRARAPLFYEGRIWSTQTTQDELGVRHKEICVELEQDQYNPEWQALKQQAADTLRREWPFPEGM
jgi:hypothetical protein